MLRFRDDVETEVSPSGCGLRREMYMIVWLASVMMSGRGKPISMRASTRGARNRVFSFRDDVETSSLRGRRGHIREIVGGCRRS